MKKQPIYVEIEIDSTLDDVWHYTQQPDLHEQWDLRFTTITYNEKVDEEAPQTFTYTTKVMPGVTVSGWGESKGTHEKEQGTKTSSLHFGTPQFLSPIKEGRGYWQYIPGERITFLTQYDYDVRFGILGQWIDTIFRPVIGWATALSFDVLARWLQTGERPATQYRRFFSYSIICFLFSFVWLYQGLVPKVIGQHPLEVEMLINLSSLSTSQATTMIVWVGVVEIIIGLLFLLRKWQHYLLVAQLVLFPILSVSAVFATPYVATAPFNVITFNGALWVLSLVAWLLRVELPTATSCKRKRGA